MALNFSEFLGYLASVLVFITFYMKTMVALRCVAISSNVVFIAYAYYEGLLPILILHGLLLPMNLFRLSQIRRLVRDSARLRERGFPVAALIPFMTERKTHPGEVLFRKGDHARGMYYIARGRVRVPELGIFLGPGDFLGEIGLFTHERERTRSAISEDEGIVYWLSEASVLHIFHQNPRFGFSLIRAITGRLVGDDRQIEGAGPDREDVAGAKGARLLLQPSGSDDHAKARQADGIIRDTARRRRFRRVAIVAVPAALLFATIYSGQTYFASLLFREAVVTTWVYTATSPISGQIKGPVPEPGDLHAGEGPVLTVRNPQADDTEVMRLAAEIGRTRERIAQLKSHLAELRETSKRWSERAEIYAGVFRDELEVELSGLRQQLDNLNRQLELSGKVAERVTTLAESGNMAPSTADETLAGVMALRSKKSELKKQLAHVKRRSEAASEGVFLTPEGNNPDWVFDSSDQLELEIVKTRDAIAEAESRLEKLRKEHKAAKKQYIRMSRAAITIAPGSVIWSVPAGPGATVGRGAPVLEWIDCSRPLVDVPVAESTLPLYRVGMSGRVHIDGLEGPVAGTVVYARGAAGALETVDLAAVSESSGESSAQVIVALEAKNPGARDCLVGRSAYVEFPKVSPLEQLRAFARL